MLPVAKRIIRLNQLIESLESGEDVPMAEMRLVVYPEDLKNLQQDLKHCVLVVSHIPLPAALKKYSALLRKADAMRTRPTSRNPQTRGPGLNRHKIPFCREESAYEKALEYLGEHLEEPGVRQWLDRWPDFDDHYKSPNASAEEVPRLTNSTSQFALEYGKLKRQRKRMKILVLRANLELCLSM